MNPSNPRPDRCAELAVIDESSFFAEGVTCLCGVDEAGRGPLAGPVVAAAVVYTDGELLRSARDSKVMTARAREAFYDRAVHKLEYGVGYGSVEDIDTINILQASLLAMWRAVSQLHTTPSLILVDGKQKLKIAIPSRAIVHGDARVSVISAASIIAKVTRDRLMADYDREYPGYGFARHFGYPTADHRSILRKLGPTPIHRRSFRGVRELLEETSK